MDYYQSTTPPEYNPVVAGDGVSSQRGSNGIEVTAIAQRQGGFLFDQRTRADGAAVPIKYTIQVCVEGTPMNLDVYAAGQPY
jgi:hypothetical protein